jgi:hypothetical protein
MFWFLTAFLTSLTLQTGYRCPLTKVDSNNTATPRYFRASEVALLIAENQTEFKYDTRLTQLEDILRSTCYLRFDISSTTVHGSSHSVSSTTISLIHPTLEDFLFLSLSFAKHFGLPLYRPILHAAAARICFTCLYCTSPSPRCISSVPTHSSVDDLLPSLVLRSWTSSVMQLYMSSTTSPAPASLAPRIRITLTSLRASSPDRRKCKPGSTLSQ